MNIDPASIPQHVVDAAFAAARPEFLANEGYMPPVGEWLPRTIAAALTALMDDEPVEVPAGDYRVWVRPSDVLAAVLARATPEVTP